MFSDAAGKRELRGWHRVGHHINYSEYKQRTFNPLLERDINYFELDFQLVCEYTNKQKKKEKFFIYFIGIYSFG
jgi:hypothetical protein